MSTIYIPDKKRLAKNTFFLYTRMIILMIVTLYTSRVVFRAMGDVDYGLYNVIGGVVGLFLIINGTMSASTSRYITYELGLQNIDRVKRVFSTAFNIHVLVALIVIFVAETIGLWMLNNVLEIPDDRLFACNIMYQITVFCSAVSICQVPFNSLIIAHEKMNIYAFLGIADAMVKLIIALSVKITIYDKLILLSCMQCFWILCQSSFYYYYSKRKWRGIIYFSKQYDKEYLRPMLSFAAYGFIGDLAYTLKSQGINILINVFFGVVVNAANAVAYQVNTAICQFSNNFTMAMVPQITKAYSSGNIESTKKIVFQGGKFTFFMLLYLILPVMFNTQYILELWLGEIPEYTISLTRLVLSLTLVESFTYTIGAAVKAHGNIRNYQLVVSGITLLTFPIAYMAYKWGAPPTAALLVSVILSAVTLLTRLYFLQHLLSISAIQYFSQVLMRSFIVLILTISIALFADRYIPDGFAGLLIDTVFIFMILTLLVLSVGMNRSDRQTLKSFIQKLKIA